MRPCCGKIMVQDSIWDLSRLCFLFYLVMFMLNLIMRTVNKTSRGYWIILLLIICLIYLIMRTVIELHFHIFFWGGK